jgi:hypothetical protein
MAEVDGPTTDDVPCWEDAIRVTETAPPLPAGMAANWWVLDSPPSPAHPRRSCVSGTALPCVPDHGAIGLRGRAVWLQRPGSSCSRASEIRGLTCSRQDAAGGRTEIPRDQRPRGALCGRARRVQRVDIVVSQLSPDLRRHQPAPTVLLSLWSGERSTCLVSLRGHDSSMCPTW